MAQKIRKSYVCYFEGQQESMYFEYLSKIIKNENEDAVISFNSCKNITSLSRKSTMQPKVAIFDFDLNKIEFEKKIKLCKKINIAYTNINFDLWLLLHKKKFNSHVVKNNDYVEEVRKVYNLENNANIKSKENINKILNQISINDIKFAIENSHFIMNNKDDEEKICCGKFSYYPNPSMNIHIFVEKILKDCDLI